MGEDVSKAVQDLRLEMKDLESAVKDAKRDASDAKHKATNAGAVSEAVTGQLRKDLERMREGYQALVVVDTEVDARISANTKALEVLERKEEQRAAREAKALEEREKQRSATTKWAIGLGLTLLGLALSMIALYFKIKG